MWIWLLSNWKLVVSGCLAGMVAVLLTFVHIRGLEIKNLKLQLTNANSVIATYKVDVAKQNDAIALWQSKSAQLQKQVDGSVGEISVMRSTYKQQIAALKKSRVNTNTIIYTDKNCKIVRQDGHAEVQKMWNNALGR